jgi:hypothetical protein
MKKMMKMKEIVIAVMLVLVMNMAFDSCIATRDTTKINKVEIGMNKSDIQHLLGKPLFKNADETGEQWGYRKVVGEVIDAEECCSLSPLTTTARWLPITRSRNSRRIVIPDGFLE